MPVSQSPARKQLSMVLPEALIAAIKQRALERGLSITGYVTALVKADLGLPDPPDATALAEQMTALEQRVKRLEGGGEMKTPKDSLLSL